MKATQKNVGGKGEKMSKFKLVVFDVEKQGKTTTTIGEKLEQIRHSNQLIFSKLIPELDAHWSGEAKIGFVRRYTELQADFDIIVKSYEELHSNLKDISSNYRKANEQSLAAVRSLK